MAVNLSGNAPAQINSTYSNPPDAQDVLAAANEGELAFRTGGLALPSAALAPAVTAGFVIIPQVSGTPTGTPTGVPAGCAALCVDATSATKKLWVWTATTGWIGTVVA